MIGGTVTDVWTFTTESDGHVDHTDANRTGGGSTPTVISEGLNDGYYTLVETQAPLGYAMHSGSVSFTISGGVLAIDTTNSGANTATGLVTNTPYAVTENGNTTYYFVFENTAGTELPGTGTAFGLSRMGFASLGTVLLTAFVALYMYKKRQRYYGLEDGAEDDNLWSD